MTCLLGALALAGCEDDAVSLGSDALGAAGMGGDQPAGAPGGNTSADGTNAGDGTDPGGGNGNGDNGTATPGDSSGDTGGDGDTDSAPGGDPADGSASMGATCGSRGLPPCADGLFCNHPPSAACGETDRPGTCAPMPDACIEIYDPVCGCDGNTYSNSCDAASNGVSVRAAGECDGGGPGNPTDPTNPTGGSGDMCGGFAGFACPAGEYCNYALGDGCDIADGLGVCQTRPQACTREYNPVCGCDGQTYGNPCSAAAAGASIMQLGECPGSGSACGGGIKCAADQRCEGASSDACGVTDGTCVDGPSACTLEYAPVCGCDGQEYGNACGATSVGAGIAQQGGC